MIENPGFVRPQVYNDILKLLYTWLCVYICMCMYVHTHIHTEKTVYKRLIYILKYFVAIVLVITTAENRLYVSK